MKGDLYCGKMSTNVSEGLQINIPFYITSVLKLSRVFISMLEKRQHQHLQSERAQDEDPSLTPSLL